MKFNKLWQWIKNLYYKYIKRIPPIPLITGKRFSRNKVFNLLRKALKTDKNIWLSDQDYGTCTKKEFEDWLQINKLNLKKYQVILYDCDDYSYELLGQATNWNSDIPFGIIWVTTPRGGHALNVLITNDEKVWLIEPQNDKIFKKPEGWKTLLVVI